jgi:8-oxo-dGTP pyrophosphatase MutT (NUDIX family)
MKVAKAVSRKKAVRKGAGVQYAALPWRIVDEKPEILLITSRRTRRWIIPKGWPMAGRKPKITAAREAAEEAGVSGVMGKRTIGSFRYLKQLRDGDNLPCLVEVFPLKVTQERSKWDEQKARKRRWHSVRAAAAAVLEPQLKAVIRRFGVRLADKQKRKKPAA